jgi:hypothetical protein
MTDARPDAPLASALPYAADFVLEVLTAAAARPYGSLAWPEINRMAARWLRPELAAGLTDTSRLGHALVLEMVEAGLLDAEVTASGDGTPLVERVLHPRIFGLQAGRRLAA